MINRSAIMKDARRRFMSRQHLGDLALTWAECLRRAWAAWRLRFKSIEQQMAQIAKAIRSYKSLVTP